MKNRKQRVLDTYIKTYYEGKTPEIIAYELGVSSQTVKTYLREIECNVDNYEHEKKAQEITGYFCVAVVILTVLFFIFQ